MKGLNSIILEGDFVHFTSKKGAADTTFLVENEGNSYGVKTSGAMAEIVAKQCKKGRGMRLVGRLAKNGKSVIIVAEHIEIKPIRK